MIIAIAEEDVDSLQNPSPSKFNNSPQSDLFFSIFFFKFGIVKSPKNKIQPYHEMF